MKYPGTDLAAFPPSRKIYIEEQSTSPCSPDLQQLPLTFPDSDLHYWELLIKRAGPGPNVFFTARTKPKTADEIRGKRKEKRAEELRLDAERIESGI